MENTIMSGQTQALAATLAAKNLTNTIAKKESEEVKTGSSNLSIFYGEFPISVSLMTATGVPIHFYAGFHVTEDPEIIEFLNKEKTVKDVTDTVKLSDVPKQPERSRNRNWAAASKFGADPSVFSPADLLKRAVASSDTLSTAAQSNS